jgi:hypothetical protein
MSEEKKKLYDPFALLSESISNIFRERQIKEIQASFASNKLPPVHATNKNLKPVEILPLLPDFDRYGVICCFLYCATKYENRISPCRVSLPINLPCKSEVKVFNDC